MNEATVRALIRRFAAAGLPDGDYGDITVSGGGTVVSIDANAVGTAEIADGAVTFAKLNGAAVITESEGIGSNDNDTSLPTSAAVKDYVDAATASSDWVEVLGSPFTISGASPYDVTGLGSYKHLRVVGLAITSSGGGVRLFRVGDSGGFLATSIYDTYGGSGTSGPLSASTAAARGFAFEIQDFNTTNGFKPVSTTSESTNACVGITTTAALDRVRILNSTASTLNGTLRIFGKT